MNQTRLSIIKNCMIAFIALFINGFGVYLTIHANIGADPWDVLNLGLSKTFGILIGNASVMVSFLILFVDVIMKEPIGIAMIIDAITVGKTIDFFNWLDIVPTPNTLLTSIIMMFIGLLITGYTQYMYMYASLGCGPRDTLLVGLKKRIHKIPIGVVSIIIFFVVTVVGYLLGGQVGIGTLITTFCAGPIMQFCFETVHFDATKIHHQNIKDSIKILKNS